MPFSDLSAIPPKDPSSESLFSSNFYHFNSSVLILFFLVSVLTKLSKRFILLNVFIEPK